MSIHEIQSFWLILGCSQSYERIPYPFELFWANLKPFKTTNSCERAHMSQIWPFGGTYSGSETAGESWFSRCSPNSAASVAQNHRILKVTSHGLSWSCHIRSLGALRLVLAKPSSTWSSESTSDLDGDRLFWARSPPENVEYQWWKRPFKNNIYFIGDVWILRTGNATL